ncbi:hypothetical protein CEP53_006195 [Fusarium sp. AF-6]|nr:hypothetical protein CEP53_006195 [Fusarium sp. AF-6]
MAPGTERVASATTSAPLRGLAVPLIECRLRDSRTIPVGRISKTLRVSPAWTWSILRLDATRTAEDSSNSRLLRI